MWETMTRSQSRLSELTLAAVLCLWDNRHYSAQTRAPMLQGWGWLPMGPGLDRACQDLLAQRQRVPGRDPCHRCPPSPGTYSERTLAGGHHPGSCPGRTVPLHPTLLHRSLLSSCCFLGIGVCYCNMNFSGLRNIYAKLWFCILKPYESVKMVYTTLKQVLFDFVNAISRQTHAMCGIEGSYLTVTELLFMTKNNIKYIMCQYLVWISVYICTSFSMCYIHTKAWCACLYYSV